MSLYSQGSPTRGHQQMLERFLHGGKDFDQRFTHLRSLGLMQVPPNYETESWLKDFRKMFKKDLDIDPAINNDRFSGPQHELQRDQLLRVEVFSQRPQVQTSIYDRKEFLSSLDALHPGVRGLSVVYLRFRYVLPHELRTYQALGDDDELVPLLSVCGQHKLTVGRCDLTYSDCARFIGFWRAQ
jgi:hypothetical protein